MDGRQVLKELSADATTRDIPIVVLTSSAIEGAERDRLLEHAQQVMSKADLSRQTLAEAVHAAATRRPAPRTSL
jgi:CheY-like chemotaxis protein